MQQIKLGLTRMIENVFPKFIQGVLNEEKTRAKSLGDYSQQIPSEKQPRQTFVSKTTFDQLFNVQLCFQQKLLEATFEGLTNKVSPIYNFEYKLELSFFYFFFIWSPSCEETSFLTTFYCLQFSHHYTHITHCKDPDRQKSCFGSIIY